MYLKDFFKKYNGKKVDFDGYYGRSVCRPVPSIQ